MSVRTLSGAGRTLEIGADIYSETALSSGANMYSAPPPDGTGTKVCSLPPALGAWRIEGEGARSSGVLSHQTARPFFCDSISSGCRARYSWINRVGSETYVSRYPERPARKS